MHDQTNNTIELEHNITKESAVMKRNKYTMTTAYTVANNAQRDTRISIESLYHPLTSVLSRSCHIWTTRRLSNI